jgi:hypothetical protein
LDPIAKTAYYCCGARAADAERANPICGDHLAHRFMNAEARAIFARFSGFKNPNASNVARHRIIDDWLRETARFVRRYSGKIRRRIEELGGRFAELNDDPARTFVEAGYRQLVQVSIVDRARELGAISVPPWLLNTLLRGLRDGYRAYIFEATHRS